MIEIIESNLSQLTKGQRRVGEYVLENMMGVGFQTIEEIAQTVGVSPATVVRFAKSCGFESYSSFHIALQDYCMHSETPATKQKVSSSYLSRNDSNEVLSDISLQIKYNLNRTFEMVRERQLMEAATMIGKANTIHILGARSSFCVTHFLFHHLNKLLGNARLINNYFGEMPEEIAMIEKEDVLIVVNMPRYLSELINITKLVKTKGVSVIAFTDGLRSPLVNTADVCFFLPYKSSSFFNSPIGSIACAEMLISLVAFMYNDRGTKNLEKNEEMTDIMKIHPKSRG